MQAYLDILKEIKDEGEYKPNRTGIGSYAIAGAMFKHDMKYGFPQLTTKYVPFKTMATELEFFIKGLTDKKWLQDRKCYIWDEWASIPIIIEDLIRTHVSVGCGDVVRVTPEVNIGLVVEEMWSSYKQSHRDETGSIVMTPKVKAAIDDIKSSGYFKDPDQLFSEDSKEFKLTMEKAMGNHRLNKKIDKVLDDKVIKLGQLLERDLGPIYGWQWRHFGAEYSNRYSNYDNRGVDQLAKVVNTLKTNPNDRRMIVSAWNPKDLDKMALPPCHYGYQVTVINGKLNLLWNQRSVDSPYGLPFNIASYGLLLHLLALESGFKEGKLIGFLGDVHAYENQMDGVNEQLTRDPNKYPLPKIVTENFKSIFDWKATDSKLVGYQSYPKIDFGKIAV